MPTTQHYYEAFETRDAWRFKVYHYDETGNREIGVYRSLKEFPTKEQAEDAAVEWCEDNGIDAEGS